MNEPFWQGEHGMQLVSAWSVQAIFWWVPVPQVLHGLHTRLEVYVGTANSYV